MFHELGGKIKATRLPRDAAGRRMTQAVPLAKSDQTMAEVKQGLSDHPQDWETINYIYVLSKTGKLIGVFSVDQLFRLPGETRVREVMVRKLVKAKPETDQEEVARLALDHGLKAIPLVDGDKRLVGVVASDTILEILHHEHKEDLLHMAGIVPDEPMRDRGHEMSMVRAVMSRSPWIVVGLFGGIFMAKVIDGFEHVLSENLVLAAFIPLIVYVANAVGAQSQTLYIRDVAMTGKVNTGMYILRQLATAGLIGLVCGGVVWGLTAVFWGAAYVGLVIGIAVVWSILAAVLFALVIPYGLIKLGSDPAIGSGPFATIVQDILSIVIYFAVASVML